jgi:hypothetical protein
MRFIAHLALANNTAFYQEFGGNSLMSAYVVKQQDSCETNCAAGVRATKTGSIECRKNRTRR